MKNFTNNPLLSILILLLITANIVTLTLLWINRSDKKRDHEGPPPGGGGQVFEFVTHELEFDSTQKLTYIKLRDEHQAAQKPLQDSIRKRKDELFTLLQQASVADSTVMSYSRRASDAEQQLDLLTFKHFQKLRAICNAKQQEKFDKIIADVLRRMAPPRRQGPPPGGPGPRRGDGPPPEGPDGPPPPGEEQPLK